MTAQRLALTLLAGCLLLAAVSLLFLALNGSTTHSNTIGEPVVDALFGLVYLTFPIVGAAIAIRQPRNAIGWLFLAAGLGAQLEDAMLGYATHTLVKEPDALPGGPYAALIADTIWIPTMAAAISLLLLLFPTGRPPSRRWNILIWIVALVDRRVRDRHRAQPRAALLLRGRAEPAGHRGGRRDPRSRGQPVGRAVPAHHARRGRGPDPALSPLHRGRARAAQVARLHGCADRAAHPNDGAPGQQVGGAGGDPRQRLHLRPDHRADPGGRWRGDPAAPPLRHRRRDQAHAGLRRAHRDACGGLRRHGAAPAGRCSPRLGHSHRGVHPGRCGAVPAGADGGSSSW